NEEDSQASVGTYVILRPRPVGLKSTSPSPPLPRTVTCFQVLNAKSVRPYSGESYLNHDPSMTRSSMSAGMAWIDGSVGGVSNGIGGFGGCCAKNVAPSNRGLVTPDAAESSGRARYAIWFSWI